MNGVSWELDAYLQWNINWQAFINEMWSKENHHLKWSVYINPCLFQYGLHQHIFCVFFAK